MYQPVTMITTMSGMVCLACDMLAQGGSCSRHLFSWSLREEMV